jgi:NAD+ synthase
MTERKNTRKLPRLGLDALAINVPAEVQRIVEALRHAVTQRLRRQGVVVGISGGIDSSVVLALCARAFPPERVLGVLMPEVESSPESAALAQDLAKRLGVPTETVDLTRALEALGCYARRDEAIRRVFPQYSRGWKAKMVLPGSLLKEETLNVFSLTVVSPGGEQVSQRLPAPEFLQIMAASNLKQRTRMSTLYYQAEVRNFAVAGTANRDEFDLGFFVKYGDGGVDLFPIVHLFKTQVFQLGEHLEVPREIQARSPTTDTYSAGSTQEEFFFRAPFGILDAIWAGMEQGASPASIGEALGLSEEQVDRVLKDILRKRKTTEYLRMPPISL